MNQLDLKLGATMNRTLALQEWQVKPRSLPRGFVITMLAATGWVFVYLIARQLIAH